MPALPSGDRQLHPAPPHSRSRGGLSAGSSEHPGRRSPHKDSRTGGSPRSLGSHSPRSASALDTLSLEFVEAARRHLEQQRGFRVAQLNELEAAPQPPPTDVVRRQVRHRLLAATRSVLADIEAALRQIDTDAYGRCHACGNRLSHGRLAILPMSRLCSSCQRRLENGADSGARDRAMAEQTS